MSFLRYLKHLRVVLLAQRQLNYLSFSYHIPAYFKVRVFPETFPVSNINKLIMFAFTGLRPSIISGPFPCKPEAAPPNGLANGHATVVPSSLSSLTSVFLTNGSRHSNGHTETVEKLEHEIQNLKAELLKSQEAVRKLKEREKQLQERLNACDKSKILFLLTCIYFLRK